jgi:cytochrome c553
MIPWQSFHGVHFGDGEVTAALPILCSRLEGDPEYGEYLAGECVTCHQATGHADGIPSIVGLPKDYFVIRSLFEYRTNVRSNEVMKLRVANLSQMTRLRRWPPISVRSTRNKENLKE